MAKKKKCPKCGWLNENKNLCEECATQIQSVTAREVCWVVIIPDGLGFKVMSGRYDSLDELLTKAGPENKLINNWLVLTFSDEIRPGKTLTSEKQLFVTIEKGIVKTDLTKYPLSAK